MGRNCAIQEGFVTLGIRAIYVWLNCFNNFPSQKKFSQYGAHLYVLWASNLGKKAVLKPSGPKALYLSIWKIASIIS